MDASDAGLSALRLFRPADGFRRWAGAAALRHAARPRRWFWWSARRKWRPALSYACSILTMRTLPPALRF